MATSRNPGRLTARSVLASTLLGTEPPELPVAVLVRAAELFGIAEGTTRVALSRMVAAGELEADDGRYRLTGRLAGRQVRQAESRSAQTRAWTGTWTLAVVRPEARAAPQRAALRDAMAQLRLAELREGVWVRPDNLEAGRLPAAQVVVDEQCTTWLAGTGHDDLVDQLWDLDGWAATAAGLDADLSATLPALEAGDTAALRPGFVLSAAVLRHLQHDPLLPAELLPARWPGPILRATYDRYDTAYRAVLLRWFRGRP